MKQVRERRPYTMLVLFALLVIVLLGLVLLATHGYATTVAQQNSHYNQRGSLAYLVTRVRAADAENAIALGEGPQGTSLVLRDITDTAVYETRIYWMDGNLLEEYAAAEAPYAPDNAVAVAKTTDFDVLLQDNLLTLTTGEGSATVALRAGGVL